MQLMDEHYLQHPYKGAKRMHTWLTKDLGYQVNIKRIERLYYKVMGLRSILPGPHTSRPNKGAGHQIYPYLLRGLKVARSNQVWAIDITYVPMPQGFMYLAAIIDIYSRYVVSWSISNTMTSEWCRSVLEEAIEKHGQPEILNTDQGSQFTASVFTEYVIDQGIKLSMDGKGRCIDNVFIERLWRSVKYEDIYIKEYKNGWELQVGVKAYFQFYNKERRHQGINDELPEERYFSSKTSQNFWEEVSEKKYFNSKLA